LHNLSPGRLRSSSWSGTLCFALHAFPSKINTFKFSQGTLQVCINPCCIHCVVSHQAVQLHFKTNLEQTLNLRVEGRRSYVLKEEMADPLAQSLEVLLSEAMTEKVGFSVDKLDDVR